MSRRPPGPSLTCRSPSARALAEVGGDPGRRLLAEPFRQLVVAGHRADLDQGLELPRLGPAVPVGPVAAQGARQGAVAALGTQVGVDLEAGPLGGHRRQAADEPAGDPLGGPGGGLGFGPGHRLVAEEHVDVGDVIELVAAELAHAEDGQAHGRGVRPEGSGEPRRGAPVHGTPMSPPGGSGPVAGLGGGHLQGGGQAGVGQVGELGRHLLHRDLAGQVADGHPQQLAALEPAQGVPGGGRLLAGHQSGRFGGELVPGPGGGEPAAVGEAVGLLGVGGHERPQGAAGRHHRDQAAAEPEPAPQPGREPVRVGVGGGDRRQGPGGQLGGGGGGDAGQQPVPAGGGGRRPRPEALEAGGGRLRLLEAEPGQRRQ
jgi:hypothetical protein